MWDRVRGRGRMYLSQAVRTEGDEIECPNRMQSAKNVIIRERIERMYINE